jgi:hypothetical protein
MVFAALDYPEHYEHKHAELVEFLKSRFPKMDSGLQCDSWIWIYLGDEKVAIDTFSSTKHWIKSSRPGPHIDKVIQALQATYSVDVYSAPEPEPHE